MRNASSKVRIIVMFGDIRGFSNFAQHIEDEDTQIIPLMDAINDLVDRFEDATGHRIENLGDGVMLIAELGDDRDDSLALDLFKKVCDFIEAVHRLIRNWPYPRPDGYRVRIACGRVVKKKRAGRSPVFYGRSMNLAHKMLRVEPSIPIIVHESAKQLITESQCRKYRMRFRHIDSPEPTPDGVQKLDMAALWELRTEERKRYAKRKVA